MATALYEFELSEEKKKNDKRIEGIRRAKEEGRYIGRKKGTIESVEFLKDKYKDTIEIINMYPKSSLRKISKLSNVSPNTVRKIKSIL